MSVRGVGCTWDRLTAGAGGRHTCGKGQVLQSHACCKCNARPKCFVQFRLVIVK